VSVYVVMAGTGSEGPDSVVAVTTSKVAAHVLSRNVPYGYIEEVPLVDTTGDACRTADGWHELNPGWKAQ
jgi:hypothetical protein